MSACIEWTRARSAAGYGQQWRNGRVEYAHRIAWEDAHGPIPAEMFVCHRCDNRACVNLEHLFLGDVGDNNRDMWRKGRGRLPHYRGEKNSAARLTQSQADAIRGDGRLLRVIAAEYGVSISAISEIRRGQTWTVRS